MSDAISRPGPGVPRLRPRHRHRVVVPALSAALAAIAGPSVAAGPVVLETVRVVRTPGYAGAIDLAGVDLLVGFEVGAASGAAWLVPDDPGRPVSRLRPPASSATLPLFGSSVAAGGRCLAVSASGADVAGLEAAGGVLVRDASGAGADRLLTHPIPRAHARFGGRFDAAGNRVIVGHAAAVGAGVFVFDAGDGALLQVLHSPTPGQSFSFGATVSTDGANALVGDWALDLEGPYGCGAVIVFDLATGEPGRTIPNPVPSDRPSAFGSTLAIDGSTVLVSARDAQPDGPVGYGRGAAWVTGTAAGSPMIELRPPAEADAWAFGLTADLEWPYAVVGSDAGFGRTGQPGAAFVFDVRDGCCVARLMPRATDPSGFEAVGSYGSAVAIEGRRVAVAATFTPPWPEGAVHLFDLTTLPCRGDVDGSGTVDMADLVGVLQAWTEGGPAGADATDLDGDGRTGLADLAVLLDLWGPCP